MSKIKEKQNGLNKYEKTTDNTAFNLLCLVGLLTVISLNSRVSEYLRTTSLEYILLFRSSYANKYLDFTMNLLSNLADKYGISIAFWVANVILSPIRAQILIATAWLSISINIVVKMMIRDARPYFYTDDYVPVSWDFEYGTPSGHAQSSTSFYLTLVTMIIKEYGVTKNKRLIYASSVFLWFFLSFTRIFVGLHTLDQIVWGLGFGITMHLLLAHVFYDKQYRLFEKLEEGKASFFNWLSITYFSLNIIWILLYFMIDNFFPTPQLWLDTINKSCSHTGRFVTLQYACLAKQFLTCGNIGAFLGIYFIGKYKVNDDVKKVNNCVNSSKPNENKTNNAKRSFKNSIIHILINMLLGAVWGIPMFIVPRTAPVPIALIWRSLFPTVSVGFLMVYFFGSIRRLIDK